MSETKLIDPDRDLSSIPVVALSPQTLAQRVPEFDPAAMAWIGTTGFNAKAGEISLLPDTSGGIATALLGLGAPGSVEGGPLIAGHLATKLPPGTYRLTEGFPDPGLATLAVGLGGYRFTRHRASENGEIRLITPDGVDGDEIRRIVAAVTLARDLINAPANRMGPAELAAAIAAIAAENNAAFDEVNGDALLARRLPLIHAVGIAAAPDRQPRLIDLTWGEANAPKVTLVGKGVCFDTGGLDIKPSSGLLLMKKDMGGAANALALASLIMGAELPVRLRLLVPAVENSVSGASFRPGDILDSRKGLSVEIGNTDAEGRLVLADALTLASEETPDLLIDFATLTGAARVALGPDVPAIFTTDDGLASELAICAEATADPLWRMPLWSPYMSMLDSKNADINNAGNGGFAGAITAALFLSRFVGAGLTWLHADIFAWSANAKPDCPEGGQAQTIRALLALLKKRYARQ